MGNESPKQVIADGSQIIKCSQCDWANTFHQSHCVQDATERKCQHQAELLRSIEKRLSLLESHTKRAVLSYKSRLDALERVTGDTGVRDDGITWKIDKWSQQDSRLLSPWFCVDGYKLFLCAFPKGNEKTKGTHLSLYLCVMEGDLDEVLIWPARFRITFEILSPWDDVPFRYTFTRDSVPRPSSDRKVYEGRVDFVSHRELASYIKDDTVYVKCRVETGDRSDIGVGDLEARVSALEACGTGVGDLEARVSALEAKISNLEDQDEFFESTRERRKIEVDEQIKSLTSQSGGITWKIMRWSGRFNKELRSPIFHVPDQYGYKLALCARPGGAGTGQGTHLSLSLVVYEGDFDELLAWPPQFRVTFEIPRIPGTSGPINDTFETPASSDSTGRVRPNNECTLVYGNLEFASHDQLAPYIKHDSLYVKCRVELLQ